MLKLAIFFTLQSKSAVETAIKEAEKACKDGSTGECAAAWDAVSVSTGACGCQDIARSSCGPLGCMSEPGSDASISYAGMPSDGKGASWRAYDG